MVRFPKKEIFDGLHKHFWSVIFPKKEILMDYVSRSCDLGKMKMGILVYYVIKLHNQISKKGNF
jgi:hypothetical protein